MYNNCSDLVVSSGGSVSYSSDHVTGIVTASFSCISGYYLQGTSTKKCFKNSTWESVKNPTCVLERTYIRNDFDVHDAGIPLWLSILLGLLAALLGLTILTCLLLCCLRLCGCIRGPICGFGGDHIYPDGISEREGCGCCDRRQRDRRVRRRSYDSDIDNHVYVIPNNERGYRIQRSHGPSQPRKAKREASPPTSTPVARQSLVSTHPSHPPMSTNMPRPSDPPDNIANVKPKIPYIEHHNKQEPDQKRNPDLKRTEVFRYSVDPDPLIQQPHRMNRVTEYVYHSNQSDSGVSSTHIIESPRDVIMKEKKRKKAVQLGQWMPHSNPVRPINTSTK